MGRKSATRKARRVVSHRDICSLRTRIRAWNTRGDVQIYTVTPRSRNKENKKKRRKEARKSAESAKTRKKIGRERARAIPTQPGKFKFFHNVLAAAKSRNAGRSRQGGGKRGGEISGRVKSRPLYVSGAIRGRVFSRDPHPPPRPTSRANSPPLRRNCPRGLLVSKTYKTTRARVRRRASALSPSRVSGPNDFFPRGKVGNPVEKIRTRPRPCPSNAGPGVISHH